MSKTLIKPQDNIEKIKSLRTRCKSTEYVNVDTFRINTITTIRKKKGLSTNDAWQLCSGNKSTLNRYVKTLSSKEVNTVTNKLNKLSVADKKEFNEFVMIDSTQIKHPQINHNILPLAEEEDKPIPKSVKDVVWMSTTTKTCQPCFCCNAIISMADWQCGHIIARKAGGTLQSQNMKQVCKNCNVKMGIMHMYEYILLNDLPGKKNLPANDPFLPFIHHMVSLVKQTERQLDNLCKGGYMSETEKNDYKKLLVNNKKD